MDEQRTPHTTTMASLAWLLLPVAWVAYFGGKSGFVFDDFRNFRDAQLDGLSLQYLLRPVGAAYFSPGHRLGNWIVQTYFPMRFGAARAFTVATFALCLMVLYLILVEISRQRAPALLLTLLYGLSVIQVGVSQWWTSALQVYPATVCSLICILFYIRYHRTGRRVLLYLSIGALAVGLLFHSKVAYVPLYLVLIRVLFLHADTPVPTAVRSAVREWRVWMAYFVPVVGFMAVFLSMWMGGRPSSALLRQYLSTLWLRVFVPGLFGALIPAGSSSALAVGGVVVAQIAFFGTVVWALCRVRRAWRGVTVFAIVFLVNAIPIGLTRIIPSVGITPGKAAYSLRYNVESMYMFVVSAAFVASQRHELVTEAARRWWKVAGFIGVASYVTLAWFGARAQSGPDWIGRQATRYVRDVQRGLRGIRYSPDASAFVDGVVPSYVLYPILAPANTVSEVLPVIDHHALFDVTGRDTFQVADDGAIRRVVFQGEAGGDVRSLFQSGSLVIDSPAASVSEQGLCVRSGKRSVLVTFTPLAPVGDGELYVALRYTSRSRRSLAFVTEPTAGGFPGAPRVMRLKDDGEQTNLFPLDGRSVRRLYVGVVPDSDVCLRQLEIGRVSAAG
jgi:hypothetical protein